MKRMSPEAGKAYQVREYQAIAKGNLPPGADSGNYCVVEEEFFSELQQMYDDQPLDGEDGASFLSLSKDKKLGEKVLKAKNFVGILEGASGSTLEILPKIHHAEENLDRTRQIFLKMLGYLGDFPGKSFRDARLQIAEMPLQEIFIRMYLDEVQVLLKKGLKSAYRTLEANLPYYKGKLQVSGQIRHNLVHKERFYVAYDEFLLDRPENRLVKATLELLGSRSRDSGNIREIWQQLSHFDGVRASIHHEKDFAQVVRDRSSSHYETLLAWSKVFLKKKSYLSAAGTEQTRSILFPMEKVFEDYVGKNLRSLLWKSELHAELQYPGKFLFPKRFALRPDIAILEGKECRFILDTKWKILKNDKSNNYGISQADMYQMYAYGKKFKVKDVILLYPLAPGLSNGMDITYDSGDEEPVRVRVFFIDLSRDIREELGELLKKLGIEAAS